MYLVVGATGMLGSEVCRLLTEKGKFVKGLIRTSSDPVKVDALRKSGVQVVTGDLRDRTSLEAACQGVTAVISTASSMPFSYSPEQNNILTVDTKGLFNLIDAAKASGVKDFVYTSFTMELDFPLHNAKRAVEQHLKESGLGYTILRPGYFMEVWLSPAVGFDAANAKAQIYGTGQKPISWISYLDVAKFAVTCLDNPAARNTILPLGGPEPLSPVQVIQIFEKVLDKRFEVQYVPESALETQQKAATDAMQQSFTGLMRCYAQGDPIDMGEALKTFPIELTSVQEYAQQMLVTT